MPPMFGLFIGGTRDGRKGGADTPTAKDFPRSDRVRAPDAH